MLRSTGQNVMANSSIPSSLRAMLETDNSLNLDERAFDRFCRQAFHHANVIDGKRSPSELFRSFDIDGDGKLNSVDDHNRLKKWLSVLSERKSALIAVDVQNDFIDGSLSIRQGPARQDPVSIIDPINRLLDTVPFHLVVYTYDWHPRDHISFIDNIHRRQLSRPNGTGGWNVGDTVHFLVDGRTVQQRVWPKHCVQHTTGSELHPRLRMVAGADRILNIYKGQNPDVDSYSAFFDNERKNKTGLHEELTRRQITDLYVCGLAYDICVAWTALDALELGYNTTIIEDCTRGLNLNDINAVKNSFQERNGVIIESDDTVAIVSGKRVPWSWAYATAKRLF